MIATPDEWRDTLVVLRALDAPPYIVFHAETAQAESAARNGPGERRARSKLQHCVSRWIKGVGNV